MLSPYAINKIIFDMTPETLSLLKENDEKLWEQYRLSAKEKEALVLACTEHRFKALADLGVLPNLLFRLARLCGYGPSQFADLLKESR